MEQIHRKEQGGQKNQQSIFKSLSGNQINCINRKNSGNRGRQTGGKKRNSENLKKQILNQEKKRRVVMKRKRSPPRQDCCVFKPLNRRGLVVVLEVIQIPDGTKGLKSFVVEKFPLTQNPKPKPSPP